MMDYRTIRALSDEAAARAAQEDLQPYVPFDRAEILRYPPFPFPSIGDYVPDGWELVETLFCDSSGLGAPGEPALTIAQLKRTLLEHEAADKDYGYAIVEQGQFQIYLGVFKQVDYARRSAHGQTA